MAANANLKMIFIHIQNYITVDELLNLKIN